MARRFSATSSTATTPLGASSGVCDSRWGCGPPLTRHGVRQGPDQEADASGSWSAWLRGRTDVCPARGWRPRSAGSTSRRRLLLSAACARSASPDDALRGLAGPAACRPGVSPAFSSGGYRDPRGAPSPPLNQSWQRSWRSGSGRRRHTWQPCERAASRGSTRSRRSSPPSGSTCSWSRRHKGRRPLRAVRAATDEVHCNGYGDVTLPERRRWRGDPDVPPPVTSH